MKKLMVLVVAMCLVAGLSGFALGDPKKKEVVVTGIVTDPMCAAKGNKEKMMDSECAKRCSSKDGKLAFVSDKDGKVWAIENVDAVKGHEGHHVKVMGHPNAEKASIHISSVSMDTGNMGKGEMKEKKKM